MEWWQIGLFALVAFWGLINYLYTVKREEFERRRVEVSPFSIMWRIGSPSDSKISSPRLKRLLRLLFSASIIVSVGALVYALKIYFENLLGVAAVFFSGGGDVSAGVETPVVPIIPGVTISLSDLPYLLLALGIAVIVHEGCHALAAMADDVPIKSWGLALFLFIPAAFVEPVEEEFSKQRLSVKARVYSAGPSSNVVAGFLVLALLIFSIPLMFDLEYGIRILDVVEGSPAYRAGLNSSMTIVAVNDRRVGEGLSYLTVLLSPQAIFDPLTEAIDSLSGVEGDILLEVKVEGRPEGETLRVTVHKYANESKIGVIIYPQVDFRPRNELFAAIEPHYMRFMMWLFIVNVGLALINATPILITDGGKLLTEAMEKAFGRAGRSASITLQAILIAVLIVNIVASMM